MGLFSGPQGGHSTKWKKPQNIVWTRPKSFVYPFQLFCHIPVFTLSITVSLFIFSLSEVARLIFNTLLVNLGLYFSKGSNLIIPFFCSILPHQQWGRAVLTLVSPHPYSFKILPLLWLPFQLFGSRQLSLPATKLETNYQPSCSWLT